jgi:hypothetical protein
MVKLKTAALVVPAFVTEAEEPGAPVVVVPAVAVAAVPVAPVAPVAPVRPEGIPKFRVAADVVPALTTVADAPGERVVVVPTAIGAAGPVAPGVPSSIVRLAGAVPSTERASVLSAPSTATVNEPRTSEETEIEDMG